MTKPTNEEIALDICLKYENDFFITLEPKENCSHINLKERVQEALDSKDSIIKELKEENERLKHQIQQWPYIIHTKSDITLSKLQKVKDLVEYANPFKSYSCEERHEIGICQHQHCANKATFEEALEILKEILGD